jgi:hypothetical protein
VKIDLPNLGGIINLIGSRKAWATVVGGFLASKTGVSPEVLAMLVTALTIALNVTIAWEDNAKKKAEK